MSHHADHESEFPKRDWNEVLSKMMEDKLGATGQRPRGKIHATDEGELRMGVTVENDTVILAFGKPIAWIGMSRIEAIALADLLKQRASEL